MCLLTIAHQSHPRYRLIVVANRDELHARPTAASQFWPEHPQLLAGRDLQAGGSWMGVTRQGRFAAVTNVREAPLPNPLRSRGDLTRNFLLDDSAPEAYLNTLSQRADAYAGFNLLLAAGDELWFYSNRGSAPGTAPQEPQKLEAGVYGLSNAALNTPWPKVEKANQALQALLTERTIDHDALIACLADRRQVNSEQLAALGRAGELEQLLSPQFIVNELYGTRASTSLMIDSDGEVDWRELRYRADGGENGRSRQQFCLDQEAASRERASRA